MKPYAVTTGLCSTVLSFLLVGGRNVCLENLKEFPLLLGESKFIYFSQMADTCKKKQDGYWINEKKERKNERVGFKKERKKERVGFKKER